mmetsp:Transcript_24783/g.64313  ORF Transcript_24783/g.64313 Transcript_24783/m.64313 type:complete len:238 (-) Transcript_24783:552-1265(-)
MEERADAGAFLLRKVRLHAVRVARRQKCGAAGRRLKADVAVGVEINDIILHHPAVHLAPEVEAAVEGHLARSLNASRVQVVGPGLRDKSLHLPVAPCNGSPAVDNLADVVELAHGVLRREAQPLVLQPVHILGALNDRRWEAASLQKLVRLAHRGRALHHAVVELFLAHAVSGNAGARRLEHWLWPWSARVGHPGRPKHRPTWAAERARRGAVRLVHVPGPPLGVIVGAEGQRAVDG